MAQPVNRSHAPGLDFRTVWHWRFESPRYSPDTHLLKGGAPGFLLHGGQGRAGGRVRHRLVKPGKELL